MKRRQKPKWVERIAKERIEMLFDLAIKTPKRAKRYVSLSRKISSRYNIPMSSIFPSWKRMICKHCNAIWTTKSVKIRTDSKTKTVIYRCLECGKVTRFGYASS